MEFLRRLLGPRKPPPLSAVERTRLEHRRRSLERQVRMARKAVVRHGCADCVKVTDPVGVALARRARLLDEELSRVRAQLAH